MQQASWVDFPLNFRIHHIPTPYSKTAQTFTKVPTLPNFLGQAVSQSVGQSINLTSVSFSFFFFFLSWVSFALPLVISHCYCYTCLHRRDLQGNLTQQPYLASPNLAWARLGLI